MTKVALRPSPVLAELVDELQAHLRAAIDAWCLQASPDTVRARHADLLAFGRFLDSAVEEPWQAALLLVRDGPDRAREHVVAWLRDQEVRGLAATTRARRCSTLRSLVQQLQHGTPPLTWSLNVKPPKWDPYDNARGPSVEAVEGALERLADEERLRDRAIVLLLYDSGLRRSEVASARVVDWDPDAPALTIRRKGGRTKRRTTSARTRDAIERWLEHTRADRHSRGPLFPGRGRRHLSGHRIAQITRALGLGGAHGLRHTAATLLAERSKDPFLVGSFLGHRSIATAQTYVDRLRDDPGRGSRIVAGEEEEES